VIKCQDRVRVRASQKEGKVYSVRRGGGACSVMVKFDGGGMRWFHPKDLEKIG